jgi:predicted RNA-binding protein YlqC (UPF0109 family)
MAIARCADKLSRRQINPKMKKLLDYILDNLIGKENYTITESSEDERVNFEVSVDKEMMGLVIGKGGKTIKAIQDLVRVKARLEDKHVYVNVVEKE